MIGIYLGIFVLVVMFIGGQWQRGYEKRKWNNGICPECHSIWESFDMDSQGGRGYKCACANYIWISYAVD